MTASVGELVVFRIYLWNDGPGTAIGLALVDTLGSCFQFVGSNPSGPLGSLQEGGALIREFDARVISSESCGNSNTAEFTSSNAGGGSDSVRVTIIGGGATLNPSGSAGSVITRKSTYTSIPTQPLTPTPIPTLTPTLSITPLLTESTSKSSASQSSTPTHDPLPTPIVSSASTLNPTRITVMLDFSIQMRNQSLKSSTTNDLIAPTDEITPLFSPAILSIASAVTALTPRPVLIGATFVTPTIDQIVSTGKGIEITFSLSSPLASKLNSHTPWLIVDYSTAGILDSWTR